MFWSNFSMLCAKKGESANVVAAKCGVKSTGTVTGWKNGAIPNNKTLSKLADYFGVTVAELTGAEQKNKPATPEGSELTAKQRKAYDMIKDLPEDKIDALIAAVEAFLTKK